MKSKLETLDPNEYWNVWHKRLPKFIKDYNDRKSRRIKILEAGCGRELHMDMSGIDYSLTGVDISEDVLKLRKYEKRDMDEISVGDLTTINFKESEFDVIYCSYVLEHIDGAEQVLEKFVRWLKPGGLLLLLIPDRDTIRGLVTRMTPHWFHVGFYKYVKKLPNAGKPGYLPFRTHYDRVVSRKGLHEYCQLHGHKLVAEYGSRFDPRQDFGALAPLFRIAFGLVRAATLGKITDAHSDLILVIEKSP